MGIPHKHAYRFVYLKSEEWKDVRLKALAREDAKCQICGLRQLRNDAHHIYYPSSVWDTSESDLVILCRSCHELCQSLFHASKKKADSIAAFLEIVKAMKRWFDSKKDMLSTCSPEETFRVGSQVATAHEIKNNGCMTCRELSGTIEYISLYSEKWVGFVPTGEKSDRMALLCSACLKDFRESVVPSQDFKTAASGITSWFKNRRKKLDPLSPR